MSKWQDSYRIGDRVEVLSCGRWLSARVTRKTATGQPEVKTIGPNPQTYGNGQLRKTSLRKAAVETPL